MLRSLQNAGICGGLAIVIALSWASPLPAQPADSVNLAEIAAKLKAYFDSIESIEVEWTQTPTDGGKYQAVSEWRWLRSGARKLLSLNSEPGGAGIKVPHMWYSFDGQDAYSVGVDMDAPRQIKQIFKTETIDQTYDDLPNPLTYMSHPLHYTQTNLVDLLPKAIFVGREQIGSAECLRIELPVFETVAGKQAATFWLDPEEGYLPRRYFQREPQLKEISDAHEQSLRLMFDFRDFMEVTDELLGEKRRFPKTATLTGRAVHRYDFTQVRINHRLDRSRFVPQAQIGAEMIVRRAGKPDVMTVYGGQAGIAKRQGEINALVKKITDERQAAAKQAPAEGPPVDARPPTSSWFWIVSAAICAVLLGGLMFWTRLRYS